MAELLKEALAESRTAQVRLIDNWTMRMIEVLPSDDAVAKYGDCEVRNWYTEGFCKEDAKGRCNRASVWIRRPGMHLGISNRNPITIYDPNGNCEHAEFIGKKSGQLITVTRNGDDDYEVWFRDPADKDNAFAGCSIRGTEAQIINEIREEV